MSPDQKQRVVGEKCELDEKIAKLYTFIQSAAYESLPSGRAKGLLVEQHTAMTDYSRILGARIALFNSTTS